MDATLERVLERLADIASAHGQELSSETLVLVTRDAARKLAAGWTADEVVAHMRNIEEINPELHEDLALARMRRTAAAAEARLAEGKS
jgi:hypothetical protein